MSYNGDARGRELDRERILRRALKGEKFEKIGRDYDLTSDGIMRTIQRMMESGDLDFLVDELGSVPGH